MRTHLQKLYAGMILPILVLTLIAPRANAQGVTTAAISGVVTDDQGGPLPGANVVALSTNPLAPRMAHLRG